MYTYLISQTHAPLDLEPRNARLRVRIARKPLNHNLARRVLSQHLIIILRVLIISHSHKLLVIVAAGEDERGDAEEIFGRNAVGIGCGAL